MFHARLNVLFAIIVWRMRGIFSLDVRKQIKIGRQQEDRNTAGGVAVMLEGLWKNKNDFIWHNEREEATKNKSEDDHIPQHRHIWEPPPPGWLKCNVDTGFNKSCSTSNRGWCIRDTSDNFHTTGTTWEVGEVSVLEGEALALKDAIHIAIYTRINRIIFESDSLRVVQVLRNKIIGNSEFFTTLRVIQSTLCNFPNFEVKFIKLQANMVAHSLAKAANSWARRSITHDIPSCIDLLIYNERS
ncbi:uncharacterized protein LOC131598381 [Vicia villosa]|uniref:uncharacterized protein LOC131598381 n=1 Tax=Vicia villosa TaxID=3911 RepID=UPI00273CDA9E|nr:uncharacterized protein LOC131598381 [Vicia villosa]